LFVTILIVYELESVDMKNSDFSDRSKLLLGAGMGAWLNIWPPAIFDSPMASFIFAYVLVFVSMFSVAMDPWGGKK
jgi:hypothetical protein